MTRQRLCSSPRPENGGQNCTGNSLEHKTCQPGQCPGIMPEHCPRCFGKLLNLLYTGTYTMRHKFSNFHLILKMQIGMKMK